MEKEVLKSMHQRLLKEFLDLVVMARIKHTTMTGYDAIRYVHDRFNLLISSGTMYSTLYSLERDGLVKAKELTRKRIYSLTPKGERTIESVQESKKAIQKFLERLLYSNSG